MFPADKDRTHGQPWEGDGPVGWLGRAPGNSREQGGVGSVVTRGLKG